MKMFLLILDYFIFWFVWLDVCEVCFFSLATPKQEGLAPANWALTEIHVHPSPTSSQNRSDSPLSEF